MEYENKYASKGIGGTALGLSIGALGVEALRGGFGNLFGGSATGCSEEHLVSRYEAAQSARIAELETEVKLRDANTFTMGEMNKFRDYVDGRFGIIERELCDQRTYNATNTAAISCMQSQIAQLASLTKLVIPNASICPGWTTTTTG
jgi:hypothetical protein